MSQIPSVQAVLTNYNSEGTVLTAIEALLQQDQPIDKIIVVDNGSRDDAKRIRKAYPEVCLIEVGQNKGLSHARNIGVAQADSDYVLILDDDVYAAPDCASKLLSAALDTGATVVCPRILLHPDDTRVQCDGASIHFAGMLALNNRDLPVEAAPAVPYACRGFIGACLLIKRQLLVDCGGFDEDYFFYLEDLELSYRLGLLGYKIWCEPNARVRHDRGPGTPGLSFRGGDQYPVRRAYYTLRHRWLTILLHYQWRSLLILTPPLLLYELAAFAECIRRGWLGAWFRAAWSLGLRLPAILARRRKWQSTRKVSDRELLTGGPLPFTTGFARQKAPATAIQILDRALNKYWGLAKRWL